jgi:Nuclease-related domain/UvrD-like helicase C-terminal domain/AAA domain
MAIMYPRELLPGETKSKGEEKVFAALRDELPNDWEAYHSASWMTRVDGAGAKDGEIDFVLCHPDHGIVCLEVKGGSVECRYGQWTNIVDGKRARIKDPFTQALDHRYNLERLIDKVDGWRGKDLFVTHAIALPDVTVHQLALAPDAPRAVLLDRTDVRDDLPRAVQRALDYHYGSRDRRRTPGAEGATMIRELLAPTVTLRVPMAEEILEEEAALISLTFEQSVALRRMGRNRRLAVYGCAGSGKTMLAVEHAKRLRAQGEDVLFVCFNKALLEHLKRTEASSGIEFYTVHGLCTRLAALAGVELPSYPRGQAPPAFFDHELPEALVDAIDVLGPRYDALLIDEAQDLKGNWFEALQLTLREETRAAIWLFLDDNQRVYDAPFEPPTEFVSFELTVNCRNTKAIHREVMKFYGGQIVPEVKGPQGRPVELIHTDDAASTVAGVIERICGQEEVPPQDVVVLSSHARAGSAVGRSSIGRFHFTEERGKLGRYVQFASIRGFKGLEAPVVILCELDDLDDATRAQQLYVGLSRARNHCVIIAPPRR